MPLVTIPVRLTLGTLLSFISLCALAAPPVAVDDVANLGDDTFIIINVLANDSDPDGDGLVVLSVSDPPFGDAFVLENNEIYYITDVGFSGSDSFTYTLGDDSSEGGTSTATVTITQGGSSGTPTVSNARRMEIVLNEVCADLASAAELDTRQQDLRNECERLVTLRSDNSENPAIVAQALDRIAPEEVITQMRLALDANRNQIDTVVQHSHRRKASGINGDRVATHVLNNRQWLGGNDEEESDVDSTLWSRHGLFTNIQIEESERDKTRLEAGYDQNLSRFTLGTDYFLSSSLLIGASIGLTTIDLDYLQASGNLEADLATLTFFGAIFHDNLSFYFQTGYSQLDFDSTRRIQYGSGSVLVDEQLSGTSEGTQLLVNTRLDWEWKLAGINLTPFARVDFVQSDIDPFSEEGDSGFAMSFGEQSADQLTLAAGLQASYSLKPTWGVWIPMFSASYLSEEESNRDTVNAAFLADPDSNRSFDLINDGGDSQFYEISVGSTLVFRGGLSGFFEYSYLGDYENLKSSMLQLGLRFEL